MITQNSFEIKSIQQNSDEWHEWRKNGVGASDAPVIMEVDPWRSSYQLMQEKLGISSGQKENAAMKWGKESEKFALQEFEKKTGLFLVPRCCENMKKRWQIVSLDGLSLDNKFQLEIKCPQKPPQDDSIPKNYYAQVQHQLAVTGNEKSFFFVWHPEKSVLSEVYRNDKYISELNEKEEEFYELLKTKTLPPKAQKEFVIMNDLSWKYYSELYLEANERKKFWEEEEKKAKDNLIALAGNENAKGEGIKLCKTMRKGTICYENIPELKSIDLDKYRKKDIESWRIDVE